MGVFRKQIFSKKLRILKATLHNWNYRFLSSK